MTDTEPANGQVSLSLPQGEPRQLPLPQRERWQPLRGGLLNLYRYDHEEFRYEQGHLLLRGNNGTGKSRVLALQLPFLFDGEVASYRMEPDRDPAKKIEWNLLLGKYPDRLGYTWLELGRLDETGTAHYLTLGCGLKAVSGQGLVGKWFFLTNQRVGQDLFLQAASGQAASKIRLSEEIGERGEVFTTAAQYRAAIDRKLFHLGTDRYTALVNLLIQLRQPQLSRKLDEGKLSKALSDALAPLSSALLGDVAEAFRSLDDDRLAVDRLEAAHGGVEEFLKSYRRYTQIAARRRAEQVRTAHATYEATMRRLRAAETELEETRLQMTEVAARLAELELDEQEASAAVRTLESSPQMRDKKALDDARQLADQRHNDAERARQDLSDAQEKRATRERESSEAATAAAEAWAAARKELATARRDAETVGVGREHKAEIETLGLPDGGSAAALTASTLTVSTLKESSRRLQEVAAKRREAVRLVAELGQALAAAETELRHAQERHTEATAELDEGLERQREAQDALATSLEALGQGYRVWHETLRELVPMEPVEMAEELDEWGRVATGTSPVELAVRQALATALQRLATHRAEVEQRQDAGRQALAELRAENERLRGGVHVPPPAPHTRSEGGRESRPGAPLWLLCDFAPEVPDEARANVEAALEAAGLLDAWVTPDGKLLDADDHDTILLSDSVPLPAEEKCLTRILRPAPERPDPRAAAIDDATIEAVLRQIGFGRDTEWAWVDADGRWQLGPLHGSWTKDAAQHLGESAREAERLRRLAALTLEIEAAEASLRELETELERQAERERRARREADEAPSSDGVRRALADVDAAVAVIRRLRERVTEAEARVTERRQQVRLAREERDETARDLGLADWVDRLPVLEDALGIYIRRLSTLWPALHAHLAAGRRSVEASERAEEARRDATRRGEIHREAEQRARQATVHRDTLREAVGAGVDEILARLEAARGRAGMLRTSIQEASKLRNQLDVEGAVKQKDIEREQENLGRESSTRDDAVASLCRFAVTRLLSVALPDLEIEDPREWSITRAVDVARRIEASLSRVDSDERAWERSQGGIPQQFYKLQEDLLEHGYQPYSTMGDDLFVALVPFQGRDRTMTELRALLTDELTERQSVLNAREREVLENHLIGEVATHLHERLHAAEEWVREMNDELRSRPTSTGMTLRFAWQPVDDGPAGLSAARRRLLGASGTWSPEEREKLGAFLQEQIQAERAKGEGTWQQQLADALDYRAWHKFSVERQQDGQWKRLTRKTHGTGSGGEKAIALTVPQFAAAAAHYRTAHAAAPRLILLDEAFVGVDADMRSKCMGLLHAFDLDFVMTSEREWGCYATLPGVAIYHLSTRPGIDAVGVTRWVWNGHERVQVEQEFSPAQRPPT